MLSPERVSRAMRQIEIALGHRQWVSLHRIIDELQRIDECELPTVEQFLQWPVDCIPGINARTKSLLDKAGIRTVSDVLEAGPEGLQQIKNVGEGTVKQLQESLETLGIRDGVSLADCVQVWEDS